MTEGTRRGGRPRIALFGLFGIGNIGNEASLAAGIAAVRRRLPDAELVVVSAVPRVVRDQYRMPTVSIATGGSEPTVSRLPGILRRFVRPLAEPIRWVSVYRFLRSVDAVIVPGTGILDDLKTRPWQTPYDLFRWTTAARLARRPFSMVGVGAGPVENRLSRWLFKHAGRSSRRITYRDEASRAFMSELGVPSPADSVQPDVVFALPRPDDVHASSENRRHIGLGLMAYYGWLPMHQEAEQEVFTAYMESMIDIARLILSAGHSVRLLVGEQVDAIAVDHLLDAFRVELGEEVADNLTFDPIQTFEELLQQIARTDAIVATRFHNVVAALMLARPTVSVGYEKNRQPMREFGLGDYCHHVDRIDSAAVVADLNRLLVEESGLVDDLRSRGQELARQAEARFDEVLGEISAGLVEDSRGSVAQDLPDDYRA